MPNRILREGILTSDRVNSLGPAAELFYRRLMSVVDDYGRFDARPSVLRVSCYPLKVDSIREADISRSLAEAQRAGLIALYEVGGKPFLQMQDFRQQERSKSKYPPPDSVCVANDIICVADAHLVGGVGVGGDGVEDGVVGEGGRRSRARGAQRAAEAAPDPGNRPADRPPPEENAWLDGLAEKFPGIDIAGERERFEAHCKKRNGSPNRAGFVGWLKKASPALTAKKQQRGRYDFE